MSTVYEREIRLFSLNSNRPLAEEISKEIGIPLSDCQVKRFSDGELYINIEESVRGDDVYIIQSTSSPVNETLMELLVMIDALKRASVRTINVVMPYYGYARQDRKARSREPITAKLVADLLTVAGATRLITMDLHAAQIQGFFNIPVDQLLGVPLISTYFETEEFKSKDIVVVSPDHGGVTRARKLAERLKAPIAIIDKRRPEANVAEVMNIVGSVEGKTAILIDDIIDTAGTITLAADAIVQAGAKEVYASCTHPVLSGPAMERIDNSSIKELVVLNTIDLQGRECSNKIKQMSVARLLGEAIMRVHEHKSVSTLFD
ncbi:MAG: ribose-phosphate diphosphokinase [Exiguobacterium sp.]|uniref:Ribose-phosphate pyrophosphokinase n=1 Tax=Exiguobacterium alkaliphilum TaxID=1428684 RepID=A0ABT2KZJ9_9BACL|nr:MULTISPECIES: ribose-phosphate diphosphokinase [Exiguobacterium]MDX5322452.1 ribose-phosphate diphosphokinase [Exiguobacterium sp.]KDN59660.1 ribose-phosphate pyrophosphokinase [Exiguobacterium sp. AB2]MCT4795869.1 ribose-phosphate diphosphokinase [Exiguobacterium alkaliphilum]MDX5424177.1 ribose-phosphate diphosphokinase [Exiguobacterium sp.]MDX6771696.1 ribose-phosphate diphosphokinase [Exiguobacterium sp.]